MAKKRSTKKNITGAAGASAPYRGSHISTEIRFSDYLAMAPGLLMVLMVIMMFILDITMPEMGKVQYTDFHNMFRVFDYTAITLGLIALICRGVKHEVRLNRSDIIFAGFMVCIIISTCVNGLSHDSAFGIPIRYIGIFNMFAFFIIYMKAATCIERVSFRATIIQLYLAVSDAIAVSVLFDRFIRQIPAYQNKVGVSAIFINSNHYGYFLVMAILIGIGFYMYGNGLRMWLGAGSAVLNLAMLALNQTLGCVISLGICIILLAVIVLLCEHALRPKLYILLAVLAAGAAAVLVLSETARGDIARLFTDMISILSGNATGDEGTLRWRMWNVAADYIREKPLFGCGCEGVTMELYNTYGVGDVHCEPLTYAIYYGLPGALLYIAGLITFAIEYLKNRDGQDMICRVAFLAALGYFFSSLFGVAVFNTVPFFFVFLGLSRS